MIDEGASKNACAKQNASVFASPCQVTACAHYNKCMQLLSMHENAISISKCR